MMFLSVLAFLCGVSCIYWAFEGSLAWDPSRPGNYTWINIGSAVGCFLISYVLWRWHVAWQWGRAMRDSRRYKQIPRDR